MEDTLKIISKNDQEFKVFIEKLNKAYQERENFGISFLPLLETDLCDSDLIFVLFNDEEMVAGACVGKNKDGQVRLRHVWSDVNKKRKGYASVLLNGIIEKLKADGESEVYLSVISTYLPAVSLYTKLGFKKISYFANNPGQPYGIRMVKRLLQKGIKTFNLMCVLKIIFGKIKYCLLFDKNSRPRWLCKVLYKNKIKDKQ